MVMKKIILPFAFALLTLCSYANTEKATLSMDTPISTFYQEITMPFQGGSASIFQGAIPDGYVSDVYYQVISGSYDEKTTITPAVDGNGENCLIINVRGGVSEEGTVYMICVYMRDGYAMVGYLTIYRE